MYSLVTVPLLSILSGWILDQLSSKVNRLCVLVNFKTFGNRSSGTGIAQKTFLDLEMRLAADAEMQFCLRETNLGSGRIISNKEFLVHESWP